VLWKEVWKETGGGRSPWKAHKLFADPRCSQAVLNFLTTTDVGRMVPCEGVGGEEDRGSEVSEGELREQAEVEKGEGGEVSGGGGIDREVAFPLVVPFSL
jgi:hypothetical protein